MPTIHLLGAALGAGMALVVLGFLYLLTENVLVESVLHVRFVLGPDGFLAASGPLAVQIGWTVGPAAAAIAGWLAAPHAVARRANAGAWMGLGTYAGTLFLASLVPDLTRAIEGRAAWTTSLLEGLVGGPILALLAGIVLVPLLACCLGGGEIWARVLRSLSPATPPVAPADTRPARTSDRALLAILIGVATCWLLFGLAIGSMIAPDGFLFGPGAQFID